MIYMMTHRQAVNYVKEASRFVPVGYRATFTHWLLAHMSFDDDGVYLLVPRGCADPWRTYH